MRVAVARVQRTSSDMPKIAYLSLGSNLGDREDQLRDAIRRLGALGSVRAVSAIYETEPVELTDQPQFLNCAVALESRLQPEELMRELLLIEQAMGRRRNVPKGPRTIDIDIVLFGNAVVNSPEVTIPHPAMHERRFVLAPLAEIAPEIKLPLLNRSVQELLSALPAGQGVNRLPAKADDQSQTTNGGS